MYPVCFSTETLICAKNMQDYLTGLKDDDGRELHYEGEAKTVYAPNKDKKALLKRRAFNLSWNQVANTAKHLGLSQLAVTVYLFRLFFILDNAQGMVKGFKTGFEHTHIRLMRIYTVQHLVHFRGCSADD